jgi:hypothetical protein
VRASLPFAWFEFLGTGIMTETYADPTLPENASRRNL